MNTTPDSLVRIPARLDFDALAPAFSRAMSHLDNAATKELDAAEIPHPLRELIRLRASQLNGCAYCVDTHAADARSAGVTAQRVDALAVWRDSGLFTAAERAALELTESVTLLAQTHVPAAVVDAAQDAFGERGTAALLALITAINMWNTVGVAARCWPVAPHADA